VAGPCGVHSSRCCCSSRGLHRSAQVNGCTIRSSSLGLRRSRSGPRPGNGRRGTGGGRRAVRHGTGRRRDAGAVAPPRHEEPLRGQLLVGGDDDAARDVEVAGQLAARRQPRPGRQAAGAHGRAQAAGDLGGQPPGGPVEGEMKVGHITFSAGGAPARHRRVPCPAPTGWSYPVIRSPSVSREDLLEMPEFSFTDLLPLGPDDTDYRLLTSDGVSTFEANGRRFLQVEPEALRLLTETAMRDVAHLLRPAHLAQLRRILDDPEASRNDRFVALDLLKSAGIASGGVLPMCQDTGTAIVMGKRGQHVLTDGKDEEHISRGVYDAYTRLNLRYSQMAPLTMWDEKNTGTNLPAQIELY